jgi:hypothetical protein
MLGKALHELGGTDIAAQVTAIARAQKRNAIRTSSSRPLGEVGVVRLVLSYVGPGHWPFIAAVSSLWRYLYSRLPDARKLVVQHPYVSWEERQRDGQPFFCTPQMTLYSSVFGSASRVRLAHADGINCSTQYYQHAAGMHAGIGALAAAHELGMRFPTTVAEGAARCNTLSVLQYLHAEGCPWHPTVCASLAKRGDFEALRWVRENGCVWYDFCIVSDAASSGNIEMTAWVKEQVRLPYRADSMSAAAGSCQTAMCQFLYAEQCPWSEYACLAAAYGGHVDTLRWLREQGCPWIEKDTAQRAAEGGSVDMMLYLRQAGIEFDAELLKAMLNVAGAYNKLAAAQWLRQQGAEWPPVLLYRCYNTDLRWQGDTLQWAREEGCDPPTE